MIKIKVTYTKKGDYLLPDLYLEKVENYGRLGRYKYEDYTLLHKTRRHFMRHY